MAVIMVAIDGSEGAIAALKQAADAAEAGRSRLVVLTVEPRNPVFHEPNAQREQIADYARSEHLPGGEAEARGIIAEDILAEARRVLHPKARIGTLYVTRTGDPAGEIVSCARDYEADTIYLGSRGLGLVGEILLGSVSGRVKSLASCEVVVVAKPH
ncbi:MAG TPA: universal stress protein [Stellaceae bacterium]|nr:universal stress protein [Stellaceae bacterium]